MMQVNSDCVGMPRKIGLRVKMLGYRTDDEGRMNYLSTRKVIYGSNIFQTLRMPDDLKPSIPDM